jgi:predicted nucleotidyltransferase
MTGETVEVAGQLEVDDQGMQRIVVGSNREALGEFIRVLH